MQGPIIRVKSCEKDGGNGNVEAGEVRLVEDPRHKRRDPAATAPPVQPKRRCPQRNVRATIRAAMTIAGNRKLVPGSVKRWNFSSRIKWLSAKRDFIRAGCS